MKGLHLLTLNIECDKHLDLVLPFLEKQSFDVICLQEVFAKNIPLFESRLGMKAIYTKLGVLDENNTLNEMGVCILSSLPIVASQIHVYYEGDGRPPIYSHEEPLRMLRKVIVAAFEKEGHLFRIATTHFTWSVGGQATDLQRDHLTKMLGYLSAYKELVLCGDFNAPRGREIFSKIADCYKDNVPPQVTTSIDATLHYAGDLQLMVDGIFTTPGYIAENVTVHGGVSDHMGLSAFIRVV